MSNTKDIKQNILILLTWTPGMPCLTVRQIVREHYLRDDLGCGLKDCEKCDQSPKEAPLLRSLESPSTAVPEPHLLIPDTNVILHQVGSDPRSLGCTEVGGRRLVRGGLRGRGYGP